MSSAALRLRFRTCRGSASYGVPSGLTMSQNMVATRPPLLRHGRICSVVGSGIATMSLSSIRANPWIDDPSNPMPSRTAFSSSSAVIVKVFRNPRTSVNQRWMNSTSFSRIFWMASPRSFSGISLLSSSTYFDPMSIVFPWCYSSAHTCRCMTPATSEVHEGDGKRVMGNISRQNANEALETANRSRDWSPSSGICTRCMDTCRGNCDVFKSSFRGREVLYPGPFSEMTAGADKDYPVDYSHLNILGYALGAKGLPEGVEGTPDNTLFTMVDTGTEFGVTNKVKQKLPIFTGALGSTEIARKHWDSFAIGTAITGISLVCGENVCGIDPGLERDANGKVTRSPDMERRVELYRRYHEGYGDILVQMNVEDTRLGVAEYVVDKLGVETMELKWGQGAKCIGGEIKVDSLDRALELQKRGYLVTPDPSDPAMQAAFRDGAIKQFERHSRLGFIDREGFAAEVARLRSLGAKRVTLKTGAYAMRELAMAIKWSSENKIDLLTIDGAPGGTGMSPWRMMQEWGIPTFYLQSMANELIAILRERGEFVPDIAIAGGFSTEDHIFKVLAMGAPHTKAVCMGRALMIPGFVGRNVGEWISANDLPKTVGKFGDSPEEIFVTYETLKAKYGDELKNMPLGAVALYTFGDKLRVGLQQLMAGSRNFEIPTISRDDIIALTADAAQVSGITYVMDKDREEATSIMKG